MLFVVVIGVTIPSPFVVILTLVALPPNKLFSIVTASRPQILPEDAPNCNVGGSSQVQFKLVTTLNIQSSKPIRRM